MPLQQSSGSFVIRIWREDTRAGEFGAPWRARVQHTRSGEAVSVQDLDSLIAFLERWMGSLSAEREAPAPVGRTSDQPRAVR